MTRLLSTGRCYVEDFSHPLALGPALEVIPGWTERPAEPRPGQGKRSDAPTVWHWSFAARMGLRCSSCRSIRPGM